MVDLVYARAYTEVLEIISYLPTEQFRKIPVEKIEFYRKNKDGNYKFKIDPFKELSDQNISREAYAIMISLYRDYFATEEQNMVIQDLLELNDKINKIERIRECDSENRKELVNHSNKKIDESIASLQDLIEMKRNVLFEKLNRLL